MSVNPFEPPKEVTEIERQPTAKQWNPWLLCFTFAWTAFVVVTNHCADNLRYMGSWPTFLAYAALIVSGNVGSLFCLYRGVRGWWHLLFLPIWFVSVLELLIVLLYTAQTAHGHR